MCGDILSRTLERFNHPESANRVTSACGIDIYRDNLLGVIGTIYRWRKAIRNICILTLVGSAAIHCGRATSPFTVAVIDVSWPAVRSTPRGAPVDPDVAMTAATSSDGSSLSCWARAAGTG